MNQQQLIQEVVRDLLVVPEAPTNGRYLSLAEAEEIVDNTIEHLRKVGDASEYVYLTGHRKRLSITLTMIPFAESEDASCLDVGCYGYMAFWAWRHLGYARVEGIEMRTDRPEAVFTRPLEMDSHSLELKIHNFNITETDWPIESAFDTVLFLETLEHVDKDPSGVLLNVARRMHRDSMLVISVPNAVSYKTLQEFMAGAPPWTYWFFHPDLNHEPRHSFEYTPIFFKMALRAAGLNDVAFRTICAYAEREAVNDFFEIGTALSVDAALFGETIIAQVRKVSDEPLFRFPDCLYSAERYYRTNDPEIRVRLDRARRSFLDAREADAANLRQARQDLQAAVAAQSAAEEEARLASRRSREAIADAQQARQDLQAAVAARSAAEAEARLASRRSREAIYLCECYLRKIQESEASWNIARQQLVEARSAMDVIHRSNSWRITAPYRAVGGAVKGALYSVARTGMLQMTTVGTLLLPSAIVYYGGVGGAFRAFRPASGFFARLIEDQAVVRERLLDRRRLLRRPALIGFSLATRILQAGSVSRAVGNAVRVLRSEGLSGVRMRLMASVPGVAGPAIVDRSEPSTRSGAGTSVLPDTRRILVAGHRVPIEDVSAGERARAKIESDG
jgi:2-polyprenyl-3-methyl-5-hydroxy-6-metoxy-1,4-benzoquinol methylase